MKKMITIVLCVAMVMGLCGCGVHYNTVQTEREGNDGRIAIL